MTGPAASRRQGLTPEQRARREERMRPSRFIGYEHDTVGMHLLTIGALGLAEAELRRAAWLNPFEPRFKKHEVETGRAGGLRR